MGIDCLLSGEELIVKHNCAIKELPSKGVKECSPKNSWIEKKQIEKKLEDKFNFINTQRIVKSNNVSVAEWEPQSRKGRVIKKNGKSWETIGHHQDNEDWLLPEEIIFLVESSELQFIVGNVPASIEDCYALLLGDECCTLNEYMVYSHLRRAGLRVVRHSPSVTVTSYEKQVNLDSVLQRHKRSPPRSSEPNQNEYEVTIIDEDISLMTKSVNNSNKSVLNNTKENIDVIEVIEIDDDGDANNKIIEEVVDSDDSSDVICISSPSYTCLDHSRLWYPTIQKSLLRPMEKFIDLCEDDSPNDVKSLIHKNMDLIRISKMKVLSLLPSAENEVTVIYSPDKRLLPSNVVPKYSEYKVNLNVKPDYYAGNNRNNDYPLLPRMPLSNMMNSVQHRPELMHHPILRKAEEMQAMAMNMIQTAATLMSTFSSQNPNELWNFVEPSNQDVVPFYSRFNTGQRQRPIHRFPNRYFRSMGRRQPYEKRFGKKRYFRKPYESNRTTYNGGTPPDFLPGSKSEIVEVSDEEGTDVSGKRKTNETSDEVTNKKPKTENIDTTIILEDSSSSLETKANLNVVTKSEESESLAIAKNSLKKESVPSLDENEICVILTSPNEVSSSSQPSSSSQLVCNNMQDTADVIQETNINQTECEQVGWPPNSAKVKLVSQDELEVNMTDGIVSKSFENREEENVSSCNRTSATEESLPASETNHGKKLPEEAVTCWEDYKNREDTQSNDEGDDTEDIEPVIKFGKCTTYESLLTSLQIFSDVPKAKERKKFKISYDVYLPEANFKKSLKILPNFRVIILQSDEELPSPMDLRSLKMEYQDDIPFLFSIVFNETVGFYLYDNISLPTILE